MFLQLLWFEIKNRLGRLSALAYFLTYFIISFLISIAFTGVFNGVNVNFGLSTKLSLNSPIVINYIVSLMGYFGILITAPIFGQSIYQDFETGFHQIIFSTPIKKSVYFFTRYLGSLISVVMILSSIGLAIFIATLMPFIDSQVISQNKIWFYISPYLSNIIFNTMVFGAIFMAVVSFFKKMMPVYVANISLFTGWLISKSIVRELDNKFIASLIEPFGFQAVHHITRYWSIAEQKTRSIPITGYFLYNRMLWLIIGSLFLGLAYKFFDPFKLNQSRKQKKNNPLLNNTPTSPKVRNTDLILTPDSFKVFYQLCLSEFKQVFSNIYFLIILLCGVLYIFAVSGQVDKIYGTQVLPVTYQVLEVIGGSFALFILIIMTYYSGELVWKDRDQHIFELIDSKPISNVYLYLSKLFSLISIQVFLSILILISCVLIQIFKGYYHFEWDVYFKHLFFYDFFPWVLLGILALFVQTISPNKYIGHFIMILYFILLSWLPSLGFNHHLYLIGILPRAIYSDMNQFGTSFYPYMTLAIYWGFFHCGVSLFTILLWRRGMILSLKDRMSELRSRMRSSYKVLIMGNLAGWVSLGVFIYYNTNILNTYQNKVTQEREQVEYERTYKTFEELPLPEVVSVNIQVDIFPETQSMNGSGTFKYRNQSKYPIKRILLNLNQESEVLELEWSKPTDLSKLDQKMGVWIYDFKDSIQANEEIELVFKIKYQPKGFKNSEFSKKIVENGTYFSGNDFFPIIGYLSEQEISDDKIRTKYQLPHKSRMHGINDQKALQQNYATQSGTWIDFEAQISTSSDQIAIAPGYLEKKWTDNHRAYFKYKMDKPILNVYEILSARYDVFEDYWKDIKIEIYHHPQHTFNLSRMMNAIKKSLEYYTENFSLYQFKQLRIIEFPRYATYAQASPNTIPFSEGIGFIARVKDGEEEGIDYPFYITAHEVAHQWWAHQVIGANVQGSTMLSESLAQYSSLMVQEKEYGPHKMQKFLKYELDKYLAGRAHESKKELPLMLNENQQYIHYEKGSLVFYALKDYLGEDTVNKVLKQYIKDFAFQNPPFTRSIDLVKRLKDVTPEDKKYLIEDMFENITFYDNRTENVSYEKLDSGKYKVTILSFNKKTRADDVGQEKEIPMNDLIDIGIFDKEGKIQYLEKQKIKSGQNQFVIEVDKEPSKAGVDPLNKLIDKISDDNCIKAKEISG